LIIFLSVFLIFSCKTVGVIAAVGGVVGEIAGVEGSIEMAESIITSAESIEKAMEDITPEQEYYIGRAVAAQILNKYDLYDSVLMERYLNEICGTLVLYSERPTLFKGYYVGILDTDEINAFATSGGHILVSRGLIECATSEDALAAVLAHEIAHIQLQHGIKAIKSDRWTNAALTTASSSLTVLSDGEMKEVIDAFDESVNGVITTMVNTGYSQSQEYDADETALEIMAAAGYNPHAMKEMLNELKVRQPKSSGGFASTHPSADKRLKNVEKKLKKYAAISVPETRVARYNHMMAIY
jgi:predicted Zn-dependent protease